MKKLLLVSSITLFCLTWSCTQQTAKQTKEEVPKEEIAIKHGVPDQAKLDSLKAAKTKGKN